MKLEHKLMFDLISSPELKISKLAISNLEISVEMASFLKTELNLEIPSLKLDVLIFTDTFDIFLIHLARADVTKSKAQLLRVFKYIKALYATMNGIQIHCALLTESRATRTSIQNDLTCMIFDRTRFEDISIWCNKMLNLRQKKAAGLEMENFQKPIKNIAFIKFLRIVSFSKTFGLYSNLSEFSGNVACAEEFSGLYLTKEPQPDKVPFCIVKGPKNYVYCLTLEQNKLLESTNKTILILGPAGAGKTIITKLKLLKRLQEYLKCQKAGACASSVGEIAVFVPENMIEEYNDFINMNMQLEKKEGNYFSQGQTVNKIIKYFSLSNTDDFINNLQMALEAGFDIFIDDSQHFYEFQRMLARCREKLQIWRERFPDRLLWIVLDWLQFIIDGPLIAPNLTIPEWLFPQAVYRLKFTLRNTSQIMDLILEVQLALINLLASSDLANEATFKGMIAIERKESAELLRRQAESRSHPAQGESAASLQESNPTFEPVLADRAVKGHSVTGPEVNIYTWKNITSPADEQKIADLLNRTLNTAIYLSKKKIIPGKSAIIFSASCLETTFGTELGNSIPSIPGLNKFYSFQTSSQEFSTVFFVLCIPLEYQDESNKSKILGNQATITSQIYQAIARAQTNLIIIIDPKSISYLENAKIYLKKFHPVCFYFVFALVDEDLRIS